MTAQRPSDLELQALAVLWEQGPSTVRVVRDELPDGRARAYTTVLSVMQKLRRKGLVRLARRAARREAVVQAHVYEAARSRREILRPLVRSLITNVFRGSPAGLVEHVLAEAGMAEAQTTVVSVRLRRQLSARQRAGGAANQPNQIQQSNVNTKVLAAKKAAKKAVKKAPAKKAPAKKAPAKKAPAKKAPAKKAARKTAKKKAAPAAKPKAVTKAKPKAKPAAKAKKARAAKKAAKKAVKKAPAKKSAKKAAKKKK